MADPLHEEIVKTREGVVRELSSLRKEVSDWKISVATDLGAISASLKSLDIQRGNDITLIVEEIKRLSESKFWKVMYVALPVLLGFLVWALQLGTNSKIDGTSRTLGTRLAITEAFYKKKLDVYVELDKQMSAISESLKELKGNPGNLDQKTAVVDQIQKLNNLSKASNLYLKKGLLDDLGDVAIMASSMADARSTTNLQPLTDRIASVEQIMKNELEGQLIPLN
jgi:hypothetical protein